MKQEAGGGALMKAHRGLASCWERMPSSHAGVPWGNGALMASEPRCPAPPAFSRSPHLHHSTSSSSIKSPSM